MATVDGREPGIDGRRDAWPRSSPSWRRRAAARRARRSAAAGSWHADDQEHARRPGDALQGLGEHEAALSSAASLADARSLRRKRGARTRQQPGWPRSGQRRARPPVSAAAPRATQDAGRDEGQHGQRPAWRRAGRSAKMRSSSRSKVRLAAAGRGQLLAGFLQLGGDAPALQRRCRRRSRGRARSSPRSLRPSIAHTRPTRTPHRRRWPGNLNGGLTRSRMSDHPTIAAAARSAWQLTALSRRSHARLA